MNEPGLILEMLGARTIAVIGLSDNPSKPSHFVSAYLQQHGYTIYPVNPALLPTPGEVLGEKVYASLAELPSKPDVVNVFRLPNAVPGIVAEMQELGLKNLWVQQGIMHLEAAATAEAGGINVVMDRCLKIEHSHAGL
jgi:uncharacterized protein